MAGLVATAPDASAAEMNGPPRPEISLKTGVEEGKPVLVATVTLDGKPVEGAKVAFLARRTFGRLSLGQEETLDDGTAAVPFPKDLPGGPEGSIDITAEIRSPAPYAGVVTQATLGGALKVATETEPFPRALWSPRAPVALLVTLFILLGAVWGTYACVVVQLVHIRKTKTS